MPGQWRFIDEAAAIRANGFGIFYCALQGCIRTAHNRRRREGTPLWTPPPDADFIVGKNENLRKEILIWDIFGTQTFGFQTPSPPSSLLIRPSCFVAMWLSSFIGSYVYRRMWVDEHNAPIMPHGVIS